MVEIICRVANLFRRVPVLFPVFSGKEAKKPAEINQQASSVVRPGIEPEFPP
jgi:hypothetical protein